MRPEYDFSSGFRLFDYVEGNHSLEEFLDDFPSVTRSQAAAALELARKALSGEG